MLDARRHDVEVRPGDVTVSAWHSTLEGSGSSAAAVRLGLHMIKGISEAGGPAIVAARQTRAFPDVADFFARTALNRHDCTASPIPMR